MKNAELLRRSRSYRAKGVHNMCVKNTQCELLLQLYTTSRSISTGDSTNAAEKLTECNDEV